MEVMEHLSGKKGLRSALLRVQVDSDLGQQEDMQGMLSRKYVAQVQEH